MKWPRRRRVWVCGVVFLLLCLWWLNFVPHAPRRVYRAIPAGAAAVTAHRRPAERWQAFMSNPATRSLLVSLGVKPDILDDAEGGAAVGDALARFAPRDLVLAYVPALGIHREPAWVLSSWVGARSHQFRWLLELRPPPGCQRHQLGRQRPYWTVDPAYLEGDLQLSFALLEGVLVGCLSRHPETLFAVFRAYDGLADSVTATAGEPDLLNWLTEADEPDRGWIRLRSLLRREDVPSPLFFALSRMEARALSGQVRAHRGWPVGDPPEKELAGEDLRRLLGATPRGMVVADQAGMAAALQTLEGLDGVRFAGDFLRTHHVEHAMVSLFGGEEGGRFHGLRVPALLVGLQCPDVPAALDALPSLMDQLNARNQWALLPRPTPVGTGLVHVVETANPGWYGDLQMEEKLAYGSAGRWLLFSSNLGTLRGLIETPGEPADGEAPGTSGWAETVAEADVPVAAWADLDRGGKTLRQGISAYALRQMMNHPETAGEQVEKLNHAKAWVDVLSSFETARIWLTPGEETTDLRFDLGP